MKQNVLIITDSDLDGCGSCLVLRWIYKGSNITQQSIDRSNPVSVFKKFDFSKFDKVYITDTYVPDEAKLIVDLPHVYIVDHHKAHYEERNAYKQAKILMKEYYTSCTKLLHDIFCKKVEFTKQQKLLVHIIDDYDCFELKFKQSRQLESVYRELRGTSQDKLNKFVDEFEKGFFGFTQVQKNIISLRQKELIEHIRECEFYIGKIDDISAVCVISGKFTNDVALYALNKYKTVICMIVIPSISKVSFRRAKSSNVNLLEICKKYCNGIGHEYAAGGDLTDMFLEKTKTFSKIV